MPSSTLIRLVAAREPRIARFWLGVVAGACSTIAPSAWATPTFTDTSSSVIVNNGRTSFTVSKSNGQMTGLTLGAKSLLGESGTSGYFSANVGDIGGTVAPYWPQRTDIPQVDHTFGTDFVDVALHYAATAAMPMDVTEHYVLRDGETGFHVYADIHHTTAMANKRIEEMRFVLRGNPSTFTTHWLSGDRHAVMPTPAQLLASTNLQDATDRLPPGTAYQAETGKDVYTKYDWSTGVEEIGPYGFYGSNYGAWVVQPHRESLIGGPTKKELTVHQTTTTPVMLGMVIGQHYGTPGSVETVGNYDRPVGPMYIHLNSGASGAAMAADAATYFNPEVHRAFYDSLGAPNWMNTAQRSNVSGVLNLPNAPADNAVVVLSDNATDFQFSKQGFQYITHAGADGTFNFANVRPGTYRLSAYRPGTFGELQRDNVTIGAASTVTLGNVAWTPPNRGSDLWQIGTFDRSGAEFRHGANNDYRQYGMWDKYAADFPGDVDFVIGQSHEATDWNFAHWERAVDGHSPQWNVLFDVGSLPANKTVTLTVAVAGQHNSNLRVKINGTTVLSNWDLPYDGNVLARSGMDAGYSSREITFSSNLLVAGTNTLQLSHASPGSSVKEGIVYDALRLEIDALLGDFDSDSDVDGADLARWQRGQSPNPYSSTDLAFWRANFGKTAAAIGVTAVVPEPASFWLTGAGAICLATRRRITPRGN